MHAQTPKQRAAKGLTAALAVILIGAALGIYWYTEGRLELAGTVRDVSVTVSSVSAGRVSAVAVNRGDRVARGQVLVRLDETARRAALADAREQLTLFAQMLPPQYRPASGAEGGGETLEQLHERRRRDEDAARDRLQRASDHEAEVSVYYSRVAIMAARREASEADRAAAEELLLTARAEKERAKEEYEALSLSRAASGADIRRVNSAQRASGAADLPVDVRVERYRQQEQRVYLALLALEEALVKAPDNGIVLGLLAAPGQDVAPGTPLVQLKPDGAVAGVFAEAGPGEWKKLKIGMRCLVRIDGEDTDRQGYIASMRPLEKADAFDVAVALLPGDAPGNTPDAAFTYADAAGLGASVTVLLREPLYKTGGGTAASNEGRTSAATAPDGAPGTASTPPGEAAPPEAPLSVRTPFGDDEPGPNASGPNTSGPDMPDAPASDSADLSSDVRRDGGLSHGGLGAPVLPPMWAPYPLKGSPLPEQGNNPSLADEKVLHNAADAPR